MIKYSVLIPAYNAETTINETVESIQQQTDKSDCLILLADDGSTDHTANMCDDLAKTYENVIVFHKSNEGSAKTRQFLLEHCTTEYCVFCDADDTWESNAFEIIDLYLQQNDVDILIFCFNLWESKTNKKNIRRDFSSKQEKKYVGEELQDIWSLLLTTDYINSMWTKVIRRSILSIQFSYPAVSRGEDKLMFINVMENAKRVMYIPNALYNYRIDNQSMTRSFDRHYFDDMITVWSVCEKKLIERSLDTSINKHDLGLGLVKQFEDYTYALYAAALSSVAQRESVVKYAESHALQKALLYVDKKGLGIKQRIFTWILSHRYYDLLGLACRIRIKLSKMRKE